MEGILRLSTSDVFVIDQAFQFKLKHIGQRLNDTVIARKLNLDQCKLRM